MNIQQLLRAARKHDASDVHVVVGLPLILRIDGQISPAKGEVITADEARSLAYELLNDEQRKVLEKEWQLCYSTLFGGTDRARVTVYYRNGCPELSIRLSEPTIRSRQDLRLPAIVDDLVRKPTGLIIITGPTGVGKTTTFHYMIDRINEEFRKKVVTIEDPVEYTHTSKKAIIVQQELLTDVHNFGSALIHVLRQDPDVIGVGEMREPDAMYTALMAAETGHLVITTLHTPDTTLAIQRIVSAFPEGQQSEVRYMMANTLQAVIAQQLLPCAKGGQRVLCCEVLVATPSVRHTIRDNAPHRLYSELQAGRKYGMNTMDHALLELYQQGDITYDTALSMAKEQQTLKDRTA
jgi:twitching motility protein PilT